MSVIALFATPLLAAQSASAPAAPPIPVTDTAAQTDATDIMVIAPELPPPPTLGAYGAQSITAATLAAVPNGRLETALALIPGAQQFRRSDSRSANPSAQGLTLRALGGNAASRTLLLRDGVPQGDPFFGAIAFNALPLDSIAAIRVTRGAGAGPFGSGALAGVVELTSRDPFAGPRFAAQASLGSFDTAGGALDLVRPLGVGAVALSLSGERSDGFWTTPTDQRVAASVPAAYRHLTGDLAFAIPAGDGRLDARLSAFDDRRTLRFAGSDSRTSGADASLRWLRDGARGGVADGAWPMELLGWLQVRDFSNVVISAASFRPTLNQRATPSLGWGGKWEIRPPVGDNALLRLGIDWRGASGRTDEVGLAANGTVTVRRRAGGASSVVGLFVEHDVRAGPLTLGGGIRVDRWALTDGALREARGDGTILTDIAYPARADTLWTARGAAAYTLAPGLDVRAAAYRGWRLPTLNELYRPFVLFPVTTRANAALMPERLTGVEAGLNWAIGDGAAGDGATIAFTVFANRLEGAIANVTIGPNVRQRTNLPAIAVHGIELSGHARWGELRVDVAGAFADAQVNGGILSGRRPAQTPRLSGYTQIQWLSGQSSVTLALRHAGSQFEDDSNSTSIKAFTTLDSSLTIPLIRRWSLSFVAENITDSRIITRNSGGSVDLGTPRAFRLTLRYE